VTSPSLIAPFVALLVIASFPAPVAAQESTEVAAVVRAFHAALVRGDSTAALELLADDATILESGGRETKAEYRAHHLPADIAFAQAVRGEPVTPDVTIVGDVAWATSTSASRGEYKGRPVDAVSAELMVLSRTGEGWRIRAIHWSSRSRSR
jgi:ketosteroid isomerase-like protein